MAGAPQRGKFGPVRWFFGLSKLGRGLLVAGAVMGLIGLFFAEENWRGRKAWDTCRRELVANGVELDWQKFVPARVADEENFAMTPFLAPLFDFNPRPRAPREQIWRDMPGHDRAANFAAALLPMDEKGQIPPARVEGRMTDLEGSLRLLRGQTNEPFASAPASSNRTESAAAVLEALQEFQPVIEELRVASQRPHSRFNIEYDAEDPFSILLPHYLVLQRVTRVLEVGASAKLALGKTEAAFQDVRLMFRLANSIRGEPFLMCLAVRNSLMRRIEQVVWEGLAGRNWSDSQLSEFQAQLQGFEVFKILERNLQAERAGFGEVAFHFLRTHKNALRTWAASSEGASLSYLLAGPAGWLYLEQVSYHRLYAERMLTGLAPESGLVRPKTIDKNREVLERDLGNSSWWRHTQFSQLLLRGLSRLLRGAAVGQNRVDEAVLACALERHRLANGDYPETLQSVVPGFAYKLPLDVCTGAPLKYRLLPNGDFVLYGVGWNEKDDGGTVVMKPDASEADPEQGDWVWPSYPAK